jgi:hypothetical protein
MHCSPSTRAKTKFSYQQKKPVKGVESGPTVSSVLPAQRLTHVIRVSSVSSMIKFHSNVLLDIAALLKKRHLLQCGSAKGSKRAPVHVFD